MICHEISPETSKPMPEGSLTDFLSAAHVIGVNPLDVSLGSVSVGSNKIASPSV